MTDNRVHRGTGNKLHAAKVAYLAGEYGVEGWAGPPPEVGGVVAGGEGRTLQIK